MIGSIGSEINIFSILFFGFIKLSYSIPVPLIWNISFFIEFSNKIHKIGQFIYIIFIKSGKPISGFLQRRRSNDGANSAGGDENEIVVNVSGGGDANTEQILEIFDALSEANQTEASWLPRRMHFENEIETFSQIEKNALFDLVSIAMDVPDEDNTKEIEKFMLELNAIEMDYGKEVYALVNEKMDQINSVLNREFTEQSRVLAA